MNQMIKCKNKCPYEKYDGCCVDCIDRETCDESCDLTVNVDKCEDAIFDEPHLQLSKINTL